MWQRHLRAAIVLGLGAFFLIGPAQSQVFMQPGRSAEAPWRPMTWHMYHSVGHDNCQGEFWAIRNGQRVNYTKKELEAALPRIRGGGNNSRWDAGRHVREHDVVWGINYDVRDMAKLVCAHEPDPAKADVRVFARCAPGEPGGKWEEIQDGSTNLCAGEP